MPDFPGRPLKDSEVEELRNKIKDPILFLCLQAGIEALEMTSKEPSENIKISLYKNWRATSRLMFQYFPVVLMASHLLDMYSEWSEETLENFEVPNFKIEIKEKNIDPTIEKIKDKITISDIAKKYNLKQEKKLWLCPFHNDKNPSLSLDNEKGVFYCFGCKAKGDLVTFYKMLKELQNGKE